MSNFSKISRLVQESGRTVNQVGDTLKHLYFLVSKGILIVEEPARLPQGMAVPSREELLSEIETALVKLQSLYKGI